MKEKHFLVDSKPPMTTLSIKSLNFKAKLVTTKDELLRAFEASVAQSRPSYFVAWNPEKIVNTAHRAEWNEIRNRSSANFADGVGVTLASKILLGEKIERIAGVDFFHDVLGVLNARSGKLFMFGSTDEILQGSIESIQKEFPNIQIVGFESGYGFKDQRLVEKIDQSKADVIAVALGSPKQEEWIYNYGMKVQSGVFIGVGGSFSILSKTVKRAPALFQRMGLEWLFRLVSQPSRIKRQIALPVFMWHLMKEKYSHGQDKK